MTTYSEGMGEEPSSDMEGEVRGALPISPALLVEELTHTVRTLQKHRARFEAVRTQGVDDTQLTGLVVEAVGELLYTAAKLESLARTLNGEGGNR